MSNDGFPYIETEVYPEDEPLTDRRPNPNNRVQRVLPAAALLAFLNSAIAFWLCRRSRAELLCSHATVSAVAALSAALSFALLTKRRSARSTLCVLLSATLFAVYFGTAAIAIPFVQFAHSGALLGRGVAVTFADKWLFAAMSALATAIAICFLVIVSGAAFRNRANAANSILLFALPFVTAISLIGICWTVRQKRLSVALSAHLHSLPFSVESAIAVFCVTFAIAALSVLLGSFRAKPLKFVGGAVWLCLSLCLFLSAFALLRQIRRGNCADKLPCRVAAEVVRADKYARVCPKGKYIGAGRERRKADLVTQWETGAASAFLNPVCCVVAPSLALAPILLSAILAIAAAITAALVAAANFLLFSARGERPSEAKRFARKRVGVATITAATTILIGAIWVFVVRAERSAPTFPQIGKVIKEGKVGSRRLAPFCYILNDLPSLSLSDCKVGDRCELTIGILALNGRFKTKMPRSSIAQINAFYISANETENDFLALKGSPAELIRRLSKLQICQRNPTAPHALLFRAAPSTRLSALKPIAAAELGAFRWKDECRDECDALLVARGVDSLAVQGRIVVKDAKGNFVAYNAPETGVRLEFGVRLNGRFVQLGVGLYDLNGVFSVSVPIPIGVSYFGELRIRDLQKHYRELSREVFVSAPPTSNRAIHIGDVALVTQSGEGCKQTDFAKMLACFAAQREAKHWLRVSLRDARDGAAVRGKIWFKVREGYGRNGKVVVGRLRARRGRIALELPAGYYTLVIWGRNRSPHFEAVPLDRERRSVVALPPATNSAFRITLQSAPNAKLEYDLGLSFRSLNGTECTLNASNLNCPSARKTIEVGGDGRQYDIIDVFRFEGGNYFSFVSGGPKYGKYAESDVSPLSAERHLSAQMHNSNDEYTVFVSSDAFSSQISNAPNGGKVGDFGVTQNSKALSAITQIWENPISFGVLQQNAETTNFFALFKAIRETETKFDLKAYFGSLLTSPCNAKIFVRSLPILYFDNKLEIESAVREFEANAEIREQIIKELKLLNESKFEFNEKEIEKTLKECKMFGESVALKPSEATETVSEAHFSKKTAPKPKKPLSQSVESHSAPFKYVAGPGEEGYSVIDNSRRPNANVLIGGEHCHSIGVYQLPAFARKCAPRPNAIDLRDKLPKNADFVLPPARFTSVFFTQIIPTNESAVVQHLRDQMGAIYITLTNGTVVYTDPNGRPSHKNLVRSERAGDAVWRAYDDGSASANFTNGTLAVIGPRGSFTRLMVPVTANVTVIEESRPVKESDLKEISPKHFSIAQNAIAENVTKNDIEYHSAPPRSVTKYFGQFCFNGNGVDSIRPLTTVSSHPISASLCKPLYNAERAFPI